MEPELLPEELELLLPEEPLLPLELDELEVDPLLPELLLLLDDDDDEDDELLLLEDDDALLLDELVDEDVVVVLLLLLLLLEVVDELVVLLEVVVELAPVPLEEVPWVPDEPELLEMPPEVQPQSAAQSSVVSAIRVFMIPPAALGGGAGAARRVRCGRPPARNV